MSYSLSVNTEEKYIRVDLSDQLTQSDIDNALNEVLTIHREQKLHHILCDERQLKVWPSDLIGFTTAMRMTNGPYVGMKLAIIRPSSLEEHIFEVAANNRTGIVRVFDNEEEAKQWLHNK